MMTTLMIWFLYLMFYSFVGWVYESILCSFLEKRPVNRGFLKGPVCPIYGFGAVAVLASMYGRGLQPWAVFLTGMVAATILEYFTSVALEKLFHLTLWDYSDHFLNYQGRVCLLGMVAFGFMSVALVEFIHPFVASYMALLSFNQQRALACAVAILTAVDLFVTLRRLIRWDALRQRLSGFHPLKHFGA